MFKLAQTTVDACRNFIGAFRDAQPALCRVYIASANSAARLRCCVQHLCYRRFHRRSFALSLGFGACVILVGERRKTLLVVFRLREKRKVAGDASFRARQMRRVNGAKTTR